MYRTTISRPTGRPVPTPTPSTPTLLLLAVLSAHSSRV
jgi:hypothetical protein